MKNVERQANLDKQKWLESEENGVDMSGSMFYCDFCAMCNNDNTCATTQEDRVKNCLCAKAYNRLKRSK